VPGGPVYGLRHILQHQIEVHLILLLAERETERTLKEEEEEGEERKRNETLSPLL